MFVSLNRKIIYSIMSALLMTSLIFVSTFYIVYGNKIQEEQLYNIRRNQQYMDLLNQNVLLSKELRQIISTHSEITFNPELIHDLFNPNQQQQQLSREQQQTLEMAKSFDQRYDAIRTGIRIFAISALLLILVIGLLGYLISRWILTPLNRLAEVSEQVSNGNLSVRIPTDRNPFFKDELDYLMRTFNQMLDNLNLVLTEVKDKEAFLQALIDNIPDGIRVTDHDGNIIISNKAYHKQLKSKIPANHLSVNTAPLKIGRNSPFTVEAIRDLSEDINFSHQQKLSSLGFLSTSIAHEMKNNLGALRIILEVTLDKLKTTPMSDPAIMQNLQMVYSELLNSIDVPERLLKLSRNTTAPAQPFNCIESLKDVIALMDFEAKSKGITINFDRPQQNYLLHGNEADFKMIALNLILNAIKAMQPGGCLTIVATPTGKSRVSISFEDTGCGIPPKEISRIFEPFYSGGHAGNNRGNGLGLTIVSSLVAKFHGQIKVDSQPGQGSCFSLSFPLIKNLAKN